MTDEALDVFARQLLLDVSHLEVSSAPQGKHTFSPNFERKMKKMIRHQKRMHSMLDNPEKWLRRKTRPMWQKVMQRVAVFFLVVLINFGAVMAFSPTARAAVLQWIVEWYETHISFQYFGEERPEEMPLYQITNLPDGYFETERNSFLLSSDVMYENDSGEFFYFYYTYMNQDTENVLIPRDAEIIPISVNQMEGYLFILTDPEAFTTITWIDEPSNIQFFIHAVTDPSELLRMAESVSEREDISPDDFEVRYIPDGYVFTKLDQTPSIVAYQYEADGVAFLSIQFSKDSPLYVDAEDATLNEVEIGDGDAYWWERNSLTYLVWGQDGIMCMVSGEVSSEEAIKIAENIQIGKE